MAMVKQAHRSTHGVGTTDYSSVCFSQSSIEPADMEPGFELKPQLTVKWRIGKPDDDGYHESPEFAVGDNGCFLQALNDTGYLYTLSLCVYGTSPAAPFSVTACLSVGTDLCLPRTTKIQGCGVHRIWRSDASEVSRVFPDCADNAWCFSVVFHVSRPVPSVEKSVQTPAHLDAHVKFEALSDGSSKLLNEGPTQDVEITCGSCSFRAHGSLLSARSEVFAVMLQSDMLEGKTRQVRIRDIEADLFGQFLGYLYSGKLPDLTVERAKQLFEVADKYAVQDLKEQCASFLADNLSKDNACEILILADRHSDLVLKESAVLYILEEKVPLRGRIWSEFADSHPELAVEVYKRFHK